MKKECTTLILLTACFASPSWACGFCDEDKVASVYEHAMVVDAARQHRYVVFCSLAGPLNDKAPALVSAALRDAADSPAEMVRFAADYSAVAFVFDPTAGSVAAMIDTLNNKLRNDGITLKLLRVMNEKPPGSE